MLQAHNLYKKNNNSSKKHKTPKNPTFRGFLFFLNQKKTKTLKTIFSTSALRIHHEIIILRHILLVFRDLHSCKLHWYVKLLGQYL